jgi:spore germination protein KA
VGVLCDGLPVALLLPVTAGELFSVEEDRSRHAAVSTVLLWLRLAALGISLLLPAVYTAAAMYHPEMIPHPLLQSMIRARAEGPFSTAAEVLGMLFSFELIQEAGVRLPEPVGQTVSLIGALIVGESAVQAKLLSPLVIIVVALAGIGGYAQPSQELGAAIRLWRFALTVLAAVLGLFGVMAGTMVLLWRLCDTEDLGLCYLGGGDGSLLRRLRKKEAAP